MTCHTRPDDRIERIGVDSLVERGFEIQRVLPFVFGDRLNHGY